MQKKRFIIDGMNFQTLKGFYDEVQTVLTSNFTGFGRNLDAFNDILRGGFGKFEYEEAITIVWNNSQKSKRDLGYAEIIKYLEQKLKLCHPSNKEFVQNEIRDAQENKGNTLFQIIIDIIAENKNIDLRLE